MWGLSLDGRQALVQRGISVSFTQRPLRGRSPSDTTRGHASPLGAAVAAGGGGKAAASPGAGAVRIAELQGEILLWCAALVWADRWAMPLFNPSCP